MKNIILILGTVLIVSAPSSPLRGMEVELRLGKAKVLELAPVPVEVKIKNPSRKKVLIKIIDLTEELLESHRQEGLYFYIRSSGVTNRILRVVGKWVSVERVKGKDEPTHQEVPPHGFISVSCHLTMDWSRLSALFEKAGEYEIYCKLILDAQEAVSDRVSLNVVAPVSDADKKARELLDPQILPYLYMPESIAIEESPRSIVRKVLKIYELNPSPEYMSQCEAGLRFWKQIEMEARKKKLGSPRGWGMISELDRSFGERTPPKQKSAKATKKEKEGSGDSK